MQYEYEREEDVETSHFGRICLAIFGLLLGIPAMLFALFVFACLAIRFESEWEDQRRQRLAHEVLQLGYAARDDPSDSRAAKKLLAMANGDEFYDASKATNAMGLMGEAARPHIPQIAKLLRHEDRWVRMEAVRTLEKLGPVSAEALPDLVSYLERCDSTGTRFKDTVDAIAKIGQPSVAALPKLRSRVGRGDESQDRMLNRAITYLEALQHGNTSAVYDDGCCCRESNAAERDESSSREAEWLANTHSVLEK